MVDGWYDNIEPLSPEDQELLKELGEKTDIEAQKEALGAEVFINDETDPVKLLKMRTYGTTLNLDGIWGGRILDTGAGSVLPYKIISKHNCRYVPNQNGEDLVEKLRRHLDRNRKDFSNKRGLQNTESKIYALTRYYKKRGLLPQDWRHRDEIVTI